MLHMLGWQELLICQATFGEKNFEALAKRVYAIPSIKDRQNITAEAAPAGLSGLARAAKAEEKVDWSESA